MSFFQWLAPLRPALARTLADFRREDGSVTVEAALILPALIFVYGATFVFFDANRSNTLAMKTTYTISDILSREDEVDEPFLDGLTKLMVRLVDSNAAPRLRVSLIRYNDDARAGEEYSLAWSYSAADSDQPKMTEEELRADLSWVPVMADDETLVVVETQVLYQPIFNVGWSDRVVWTNRMVTRSRFTSMLDKTDEPEAVDVGGDSDDQDSAGSDPI